MTGHAINRWACRIAFPSNEVIELWLYNRPASTIGVYRPEVEKFRNRIGSKSMDRVTLGDLQAYAIDL